MKRKILIITLGAIIPISTIFIEDVANYIFNQNKKIIETHLSDKLNGQVNLGDIQFSFSSVQVSTFDLKQKDFAINIKEVELLPNKNIFSLLKTNNFVDTINLNKVKIDRKTTSSKINPNILKNNLAFALPYYQGVNQVKIKEIIDPIFSLTDTQLSKKANKQLEISTKLLFKDNQFSFKGTADIEKFLSSNKLDATIIGESNKLDLKLANYFINDPDIKVVDGYVNLKTEINIKDNKISIQGENNVSDFQIDFFGHPLRFDNHFVKTSFTKQKAELHFPNKIKVNNTDLDVEHIVFEADEKYANLKNILIESKNLKYYGKFSEKFNQIKSDKEISIDFNLVDLNYLNYLGILDIPKPFNNTILKNGNFKFVFQPVNGKGYQMTYKAHANASLKVDTTQFKADAKMEGHQLSFENFNIDNINQKGFVQYNLTNDDLILNTNLNVNQPLLTFMNKHFGIPNNIHLNKNNADLNLELQRINHQYQYIGSIQLNNNDLSVDYGNKTYQVENSLGKITFSDKKIDDVSLTMDSIYQGENRINAITLNTQNKQDVFEAQFKSDFLNGQLTYNKNQDNLAINLGKIDYDLKYNNKAKEIIAENAEHIEQLKKLELPKEIKLTVEDSSLNDFHIGKINMEALVNKDSTHLLKTTVKNELANLDIESNLDLRQLKISNKANLKIQDLGKFNQNYQLKDTITNGDLLAKGTFETQLTNLEPQALIHNTQGEIKFESHDGEFVKIDTGAGALINLLSFQNIPNLMALNFKKVFNDKLTYDNIYGDLKVQGYNVTVNNLNMDSKIATSKMNGDIQLDSQEINLNLNVEPKISNSIFFTTMGATALLSPYTLIGATLIDKFIKLPEIIDYDYKITGTLSEPQYTEQ